MIRMILLLSLLIQSYLIAAQNSPTTLSTEIKNATVFLKSATLQRTGTIQINPGINTLVVKGLSPYINTKSITVKGEGDFTVLGVDHRLNYIDKVEKSKQTKSLENKINIIKQKDYLSRGRLKILEEKRSLLNSNRKIGTTEKGVSVEEFKAMMSFYEDQLTQIIAEEIEINGSINSLEDELDELQQQIKQINEKKSLPTSEITIKVDAENSIKAGFMVSYLVSNAGWYPKYDVRVPDIDQPLQLIYKAEVHQNTGEDWKDVKLKFSNGTPNKSGQAPSLSPWRLDYTWNTVYSNNNQYIDPSSIRTVTGIIKDDTGAPLIGATVLVVGSTIGTATDINGRYELTLPNQGRQLEVSYTGYSSQLININSGVVNITLESDLVLLEEVVVTGTSSRLAGATSGIMIRGNSSFSKKKEAKINAVTVVENTTTVEFAIDKPYTLISGSTSVAIELIQYDIDANYEYIAVPKLETSAFLIAQIPQWDQYNLLEGEANLYFQETYIGRTILDARSMSDTLELSMGRDQNILVARNKINNYNKKPTVGSNQIDSRSYEILIRNKKPKPINITVMDQVPIAANNDINIKLKNISNALLNQTTGALQWKLNIPGNQQATKLLEYEVKYPKSGDVALE